MIPDTDVDQFVDALASRIALFDKPALGETKRFVDMQVCCRAGNSAGVDVCACVPFYLEFS